MFTLIDNFAEYRFGFVEFASHVDVLRALACEEEGNGGQGIGLCAAYNGVIVYVLQDSIKLGL